MMSSFRYLVLIVFFLHYSCDVTEPEYEPIEKHMCEIHLIELEKNIDTLLTLGYHPQFSFDSQKIIFIWNDSIEEIKRKIMIMDLDNRSLKPITDSYKYLDDVNCSPTRPQIVFSAQDFLNQSWDLYIVNEDGTSLVNITNTIDQNEYQPIFSPDGNFISYIQVDRYSWKYRLQLKDLHSEPRTLKISDKNRLRNLCFTLNGKKIVYSEESNRANGPKDVKLIGVNDNDAEKLLEGINPTRLVTLTGRFVFNDRYHIKGYDLSNNEITDIGSGSSLALSGDGTKIVYMENWMNVTYMLIMNYDGSAVDTLVADEHRYNRYSFSYYPTFSSDRSMIVYSKEYRYYE